ncbi:hypothetical protein DH2020_001262 [Rehmannia glutinosa]|uniref:F-box domain-containing protein n=1 Tax=Rehmannia glutinosa TaxID=99300 RepID=A0ABR0XZ96_REHGL
MTCKRKRLKSIDSLPDDLLFKILLHLPTQDIYDKARLVCRKWYRIIHTHHFVYEHLQHTTYGLLFQGFVENAIFLALRQGRIEISRYSFKFIVPVWATCNGLIVQFDCHNYKAIYITNPITKQIFVIPSFISIMVRKHLCGIAYAMASMEYKVVVTHDPDGVLKGQRCAILTVGVDKSWRNVPTEHLSLEARKVFNKGPLITEGFMHWAMGGGVLTLNVETETITETPAPVPQVYTRVQMCYVSTGKYLTLLIRCGQYLWQFWEMKPETGEWRKLPNISLEAQKCRMEQLGFEHSDTIYPSGWLKYPEVLTFVVSGPDRSSMIFCHLLTQEIDLIDIPNFTDLHKVVVHRNSLVWSSDI